MFAPNFVNNSSPESEAELFLAGGQTGGADISVTEVDSLAESQHRDVIGQPPGVEPWVPDHAPHRVLLVLHQLRPLEGARIVLAHPHLQTSVEKIVKNRDRPRFYKANGTWHTVFPIIHGSSSLGFELVLTWS